MSGIDDFQNYLEWLYQTSYQIFGFDISRETWRNRFYYDNTQEPKEVWSGTPRKQFTSEQREYLDKIKSLAVDVEYEEIQS